MSEKWFKRANSYAWCWKHLSLFMLLLCFYGCGGGGSAEIASAPINPPVTQLVAHNNYEGIWKERCTWKLRPPSFARSSIACE